MNAAFDQSTDVFIVGAGPIGLELAVALKRGRVDYLHVDAGQIAQTITWYPRGVRFFSSPERIAIAGVPMVTADQEKATREEYLAYLRGIVQQFDLQVRTYEKVVGIDALADGGGFDITTRHRDRQRRYHCRKLVLALGDMHHPRRLDVPGEDLPHVSHYFDEPHRYFQQKLLVVGGRNSAVEAAIRCHRAGAQVALSYRGDAFDGRSVKYWLKPEIEMLCKTQQIAWHPRTVPIEITPTHVTLADVDGRRQMTIEADFVLLMTGYRMDTTLFEMAGVNLRDPHKIPCHDRATMQTNVPGLYIAGTCAGGYRRDEAGLFIENCHAHVRRIVEAITGRTPVVNQPVVISHDDRIPQGMEES